MKDNQNTAIILSVINAQVRADLGKYEIYSVPDKENLLNKKTYHLNVLLK